jgi:hypothetical protein
MYGYVYLTTNLINGKKYIGLHKSNKFDESYYGSGKLLKRALVKYGKENFTIEILQQCDSYDELILAELHHIDRHNAKHSDRYYNIMNTPQPILFGNDNGFYGKTHSEESKRKMGLTKYKKYKERGYSLKMFVCIINGEEFYNFSHIKTKYKLTNKRIKYNFGDDSITNWYMCDDIVREEYIEYFNIRSKRTKEFYQKLSVLYSGRTNSPEVRKKISDGLKGKKKSIEHVNAINKNPEKIRKTAEAHRGMKRSEESKKRMSESSWIKKHGARNKGTKLYHNVELQLLKEFRESDDIPEGWILGTGKAVYHDPISKKNKLLFPWEIPSDWIKGRHKCS